MPVEGKDLDGVISSKEALELNRIPQSMVIIGGGVIGVEMAFIYNALGTKVKIIEMMPQLLPKQDKEIVDLFTKELRKQGIDICTNSKVKSIEKTAEGLKLNYETSEGIKIVEAELVLMAVGRTPQTDLLGDFPLAVNKTGIFVDDYLRSRGCYRKEHVGPCSIPSRDYCG